MCVCVCRLQPEFAEHEAASVLFKSLLPPEADRRTVSNIFQRLLGKFQLSSNPPITLVDPHVVNVGGSTPEEALQSICGL